MVTAANVISHSAHRPEMLYANWWLWPKFETILGGILLHS